MACPTGYIEVNGSCVYAFGNDSGVAPDGTPLPQEKKSGGFWDGVNKNLPDILIGVGSVWGASKNTQQPAPAPGGPQPTPPAKSSIPVWVWIVLGFLVLIVLVLFLRGKSAAAPSN
ncbi:MAG: hypothetical protein IPM36_18535 [Lewinellaceae bacterium]|nr:hypothetical protein [Lewinellaceae bacterium]